MRFSIDQGLVTLFGSETRLRTLAPLANSTGPLTAYRVADLADLPRTKVNKELARLAKAGIVAVRSTGTGRRLWVMDDPDLRRLLRRKVRIDWAGDLAASAPELAKRTRSVIDASRAMPLAPGLLRGRVRRRNSPDFDRPPEKDAALRRNGLRVSSRSSSTR